MPTRDEDRELARLFEELRRADEVLAPGFRDVLERRRVREVKPVARRAMRFASVAALAIALGITVLLVRRPGAHPRAASGPTLADWKAPTDSLLRTPGVELLDSQPRFPAVPNFDHKGVLR